MASHDQQLTKKLAELKPFLEHRLKQQEEEVSYLRSFLEVVDSLLAERSFRPVDISQASATSSTPTKTQPAAKAPQDSIPIMTTEGVRIAFMTVDSNTIHVVPDANAKLDPNSPPLRSFLLAKVLEPMQTKDKEAAAQGSIPPDNILTYNLEQNDTLKAIHIQNFGDDRRLLELKNAIRWTLRRMYEKTSPKKQ